MATISALPAPNDASPTLQQFPVVLPAPWTAVTPDAVRTRGTTTSGPYGTPFVRETTPTPPPTLRSTRRRLHIPEP
ncbi:MAG: hypothetical protein M0013_01305 [Actinomycetota bacterium]|nr:hypothetical protein [Actinomycetota bacterium]